jgi:TonB family protein
MRTPILAVLLLGATCSLVQQADTPLQPSQLKDPRAILDAAAPFYNFKDSSLKPWHLKATYQLYDQLGRPTEKGTYEFWWVSPDVYRSSWGRPGATHISWHASEGRTAFTESGDRLTYFEADLPTELFSPLSWARRIDPAKPPLERKELKTRGATLPCVTAPAFKHQDAADFRMMDTYCFDPLVPVLRISYRFQGLVETTYNNIAKAQGRFVARDIQVSAGEQKLFTATVESISPLNPDDAALTLPKDAIFKLDAFQALIDATPAEATKKVAPVYPTLAKQQREQGMVLVDVVIAADGTVKDPRVIYSPFPLLAQSSLEAVAQWHYKPSKVDGNPVEVVTLINSTYAISQ